MWRPHFTPLLPVDLPTSWNVDPALALGFNQKPALIRYWDTDDLGGFHVSAVGREQRHSKFRNFASCARKHVRFGSLADISERTGMSALPPEADMLIVGINVC